MIFLAPTLKASALDCAFSKPMYFLPAFFSPVDLMMSQKSGI